MGLAGGLNLYGFAGGDPVNFSDPFGLCAEDACLVEGGVGGLVVLGIGATATVAALTQGRKLGEAFGAGVDAAAIGSIVNLAKNRGTIKRLEGEESVIDEHFTKLSTLGQPGGDDPNNRNKWKDDIKRHIRIAREYLEKIRGERNREPWEQKIKQWEERVDKVK